MLNKARGALDALLQAMVIALMIILTGVVIIAVIFRFFDNSLSWYDEVASVLLAWLTYYGAALAALKRSHIGFDGIVVAVAPHWRLVFVIISETCVFGFFILLAWTGLRVVEVLEGDTLVSLPEVSVQLTQSVIPIAAALFVICEALSLPDYWQRIRAGVSHDQAEAIEAIEAEEKADR